MSSAATSILCCAGNCLCQACNNICGDSMKINPKLFSRIGYIVLSLASVGVSLLVLFFLPGILKPFSSFVHCPKNTGGAETDCLGISNVYRMSLALVIMHIMVIFMSLCGNKCVKVVNQDCWSLKILIVIGLYISFFFISNSFFIVYAIIARYISIIFLLFQIMVTISFAHVINISLVNGLDEANNKGEPGTKYKFWLIFLTIIFLGFGVYWIFLSYYNFYGKFYNIIIISLTVLFGGAFTFLSISEIVTRKRLLTSIYIFSFISYLCWSALNSQPTDKFIIDFWDMFIGLVYLFLALSFIGFYVKKSETEFVNIDKPTDEEKVLNGIPILETDVKKEEKNGLIEKGNETEKKEDEVEEVTKAYIYFHIFMIFMSIYYCMLLTNWNVLDNDINIGTLQTWTSFWVKIITLILSVFLYMWVLLAPVLFPDREFDF